MNKNLEDGFFRSVDNIKYLFDAPMFESSQVYFNKFEKEVRPYLQGRFTFLKGIYAGLPYLFKAFDAAKDTIDRQYDQLMLTEKGKLSVNSRKRQQQLEDNFIALEDFLYTILGCDEKLHKQILEMLRQEERRYNLPIYKKVEQIVKGRCFEIDKERFDRRMKQ